MKSGKFTLRQVKLLFALWAGQGVLLKNPRLVLEDPLSSLLHNILDNFTLTVHFVDFDTRFGGHQGNFLEPTWPPKQQNCSVTERLEWSAIFLEYLQLMLHICNRFASFISLRRWRSQVRKNNRIHPTVFGPTKWSFATNQLFFFPSR